MIVLALALLCSPAWQSCHAENVLSYRMEIHSCRGDEEQRVSDCWDEGLSEFDGCEDDAAVCMGAGEMAAKLCISESMDYGVCRAAAKQDLIDIDAVCGQLYGACQ